MKNLKWKREPFQTGNRLEQQLTLSYKGIQYSIKEYPTLSETYKPHITIENWSLLDDNTKNDIEAKVALLGYKFPSQGGVKGQPKYRQIYPLKGQEIKCPAELVKRLAMCVDIITELINLK